jgi:hypothetical protein
MVTFKCEVDGCDNKDVAYNFLGNPETAMCGGCKTELSATDLRDDPVTINPIIGEAD